jgi:hypothetical protein
MGFEEKSFVGLREVSKRVLRERVAKPFRKKNLLKSSLEIRNVLQVL